METESELTYKLDTGITKYRYCTRLIAVFDVAFATLGFFFNPFNDDADFSFLYWKITITCCVFQMWMIVSINLFVATQTAENPSKCIKLCNYWLIISTFAFIVFLGIVVLVPPKQSDADLNSSTASNYLLHLSAQTYLKALIILIYRAVATIIVMKLRSKLTLLASASSSVSFLSSASSSSLSTEETRVLKKNNLSPYYPDLLNNNRNVMRKCQCGDMKIIQDEDDHSSGGCPGVNGHTNNHMHSNSTNPPSLPTHSQYVHNIIHTHENANTRAHLNYNNNNNNNHSPNNGYFSASSAQSNSLLHSLHTSATSSSGNNIGAQNVSLYFPPSSDSNGQIINDNNQNSVRVIPV